MYIRPIAIEYPPKNPLWGSRKQGYEGSQSDTVTPKALAIGQGGAKKDAN